MKIVFPDFPSVKAYGQHSTIFQRSAFARIGSIFAFLFSLLFLVVITGVYISVVFLTDYAARETLSAEINGLNEIYKQRLLPGLREAVERKASAVSNQNTFLLLTPTGAILEGNTTKVPPWIELVGVTYSPEGQAIGQRIMLNGDFQLIVALDISSQTMMLHRMRSGFMFLGLILIFISIVGGLAIGRFSLSAVDMLNVTLRQVEGGNLAARAEHFGSDDEFGELTTNVNRMLDRLGILVAGLREVSDRVAHEMRTPLTRIRFSLDKLRKNPAEVSRNQLDDLVEDVDELITVFSALLDVATAEAAAGDNLRLVPVAFNEVINDVFELYDAVAEERTVNLLILQNAEVSILGEKPLLLRMIANIVDNAIKFTPPGGNVIIASAIQGLELAVTIADEGPGIDDGFIERAFNRFSRGSRTESISGHGLGLALVRAIAIRHGIKINLVNHQKGLCVSLRCSIVSKHV